MEHTKRPHDKFFDLPIDGLETREIPMKTLMACYDRFLQEGDLHSAFAALEFGEKSNFLPAKLELARLLHREPGLMNTRGAQLLRSERLYREILNLPDLNRSMEGKLCLEAADVFRDLNQTVAWMWALLRARRLGQTVSEDTLSRCRKRLQTVELKTLADCREDCCRLGQEMARAGELRNAEGFLLEAAASPNRDLSGRSCLYLAEVYDEMSLREPRYHADAEKYFRLAARKGHPELIRPR